MRLVSIESAEEDAAINSVIGKQTNTFFTTRVYFFAQHNNIKKAKELI
jgi:hypothetical protein